VKPQQIGWSKRDRDTLVLQHAIAHGEQLAARYRSKGKAPGTDVHAHPLGMLVRGPLHILVRTLGDDAQIHQFDVHKLTATRLLDARRVEPAGFDFQAYATGDLAFASHGPIRMKLRFDPDTGAHLRDALLSDDQTWHEYSDGSVVVEATKEDDRQLLWWIFSFGGRVEVLEPVSLRKRVLAELRRAVGVYGEGTS
jgi:predicted DNA-binding transcriptional regulator YafY